MSRNTVERLLDLEEPPRCARATCGSGLDLWVPRRPFAAATRAFRATVPGGRMPVGCKLRIPTPRNTKIALTGSGCQEVSKRASSVIRWERAGNGFDVTRRGIAGIAPNSKRPDSPSRFAQAAIEYSRRTPPSRSIRRICTEPSSGPSGTRGTGTSRSIPRCGLAEL